MLKEEREKKRKRQHTCAQLIYCSIYSYFIALIFFRSSSKHFPIPSRAMHTDRAQFILWLFFYLSFFPLCAENGNENDTIKFINKKKLPIKR